MTKKLFTVIIPCHNDCGKANRLCDWIFKNPYTPIESLDEIFVAHNGCKRLPSSQKKNNLPWASKAKTINYHAQKIKSKYIVVIDADVKISQFALLAFKKAMIDKKKFGTAHQIYVDEKQRIVGNSVLPEFNGACWFIKIDLLCKWPIPENVVTEDTAYFSLMKKHKVKAELIIDAVTYADVFESNLKKKLNQGTRYYLGALEMMKIKDFSYVHLVVLPIVMTTFAISLFVIDFWSGLFALVLVTLFTSIEFLTFDVKEMKKRWKKYGWQLFSSSYNFLIAPFIASYLFIRRKTIW